MKSFLILLLFVTPLYANDNPYSAINKRNAFELTSEKPVASPPPVFKPTSTNIFLTGITRFKEHKKIHLVIREAGQPDKFVSLRVNEKQYNIELKKILQDSVVISTNTGARILSFKANALPTIITKAPITRSASPSRYSRDKKETKKEEKKSVSQPPKPQVIKVPSRSPQVDPRIIEKGLEYLGKMEEGEKRDYLLNRMESIQSGQYQPKSEHDKRKKKRK